LQVDRSLAECIQEVELDFAGPACQNVDYL